MKATPKSKIHLTAKSKEEGAFKPQQNKRAKHMAVDTNPSDSMIAKGAADIDLTAADVLAGLHDVGIDTSTMPIHTLDHFVKLHSGKPAINTVSIQLNEISKQKRKAEKEAVNADSRVAEAANPAATAEDKVDINPALHTCDGGGSGNSAVNIVTTDTSVVPLDTSALVVATNVVVLKDVHIRKRPHAAMNEAAIEAVGHENTVVKVVDTDQTIRTCDGSTRADSAVNIAAHKSATNAKQDSGNLASTSYSRVRIAKGAKCNEAADGRHKKPGLKALPKERAHAPLHNSATRHKYDSAKALENNDHAKHPVDNQSGKISKEVSSNLHQDDNFHPHLYKDE